MEDLTSPAILDTACQVHSCVHPMYLSTITINNAYGVGESDQRAWQDGFKLFFRRKSFDPWTPSSESTNCPIDLQYNNTTNFWSISYVTDTTLNGDIRTVWLYIDTKTVLTFLSTAIYCTV